MGFPEHKQKPKWQHNPTTRVETHPGTPPFAPPTHHYFAMARSAYRAQPLHSRFFRLRRPLEHFNRRSKLTLFKLRMCMAQKCYGERRGDIHQGVWVVSSSSPVNSVISTSYTCLVTAAKKLMKHCEIGRLGCLTSPRLNYVSISGGANYPPPFINSLRKGRFSNFLNRPQE